MPYTTYLVEKGASHSFVAEAKPPTVTMPRIKALMTGSLPGFVDVVRNLNSPVLLEDNVLRQAAAAGKRIIFYGDETWVRLFPKHFVEHDGTTSFFVSDYTEVDDNVTRHLETVLKRDDWDVLILHYLGLDHIGHLSGPHSPLVGHKLSEMDSVLMKIHLALLSKERASLLPSLLVLCGDHGMSETGSHGASSMEEVSTPLVLISSAFERSPGNARRPRHVQQTDLAATLAIGLGLPIPQSSVGRLLFQVLEGRPMRDQLRFLHLNAVQLSRLLQENVPLYEKDPGFEQFKISERLHGNWIKLYLEENSSEVLLNLGTKVLRQYLDALQSLSLSLSRQVAHYDTYSMAVGAALVLEVFALLLLSIPKALGPAAELDMPLLSPLFSLLFYLMLLGLWAVHVTVCTSTESSCYFCSVSWLVAGTAMVLLSALLCAILSELTKMVGGARRHAGKSLAACLWPWSELDVLIVMGTVGHVLSLGASSFIEEEHQTWRCSPMSRVVLALGLLGVYCYRAAIGNVMSPWQRGSKDVSKGIMEARFVYVFVLGILFTGTKDLLRSQVAAAGAKARTVGLWEIHSGLVLLAALLLRPHNLPVLVSSLLVQTLMANFIWKPLSHDTAEVTVMHYWFGQAFFYFQGNSNNIATVDISAGFVGLEQYVEGPAVFLTAFATYVGPVLWASHLVNYLSSEASSLPALRHACFCYALVGSVPVSAYVVLVTSLRYHLFIWSVFSPKLLYEGMRALVTAAVCSFFTAADQATLART
ncbi:GPI ethanolamine phosphate transferase 2 isoform X4 [Echinops telfairi]|uniref:GPI ethanolamine phosphate transferase 2 isoform X4 n=1 Tax=Echinops telfairi TaxID=9371 RepID=A0AC55D105_ECHTE|nr:GPI ethanolamine phosphate transferase 2 isoform X4 [Echinops telfairi]